MAGSMICTDCGSSCRSLYGSDGYCTFSYVGHYHDNNAIIF